MPQPSDREIELFNAALELAAYERAAYLDQVCAGDAGMRRRVEELLGAEVRAGRFLADPVGGHAGLGATTRPLLAPEAKAGDRIGRYKLLQQIGEGGCGVVYMAEQEEPVRRRVALKVIKLGMDTKQVIARFEAERQALALMDHPNIAKVLDAGATETGRPYFVMELVRGVKLTDFCDENKLSTQDRLKLFIQVCQAIQHAHQKGIIHRDIKPSNILVTVNDGVPVPKVIDFGIAKATQGRLTDQTLFTAFEQFIGTPAYMSPEQAVMTSLDIDTRSDIYSLGVLLYELLTGHTPFDTQELLAAGLDEMRRTIRERQPLRPSTRMLQELSTVAAARQKAGDALPTHGGALPSRRYGQVRERIHQVRGDLDWIVMKCLEKDRARRYETANGLAMDIHRHLGCEPVVARPPSRLYEFQKTVRRHKFGFAVTAAGLVLLAGAVAVSTWQAVRLGREHRAGTDRLFASYLAQARARRRDHREGQRLESLGAVAKAAAIRSSVESRNEAIACLAMSELQFSDPQESSDPEGECWSPDLELRALREPAGRVRVRRTRDNREIAWLPSPGAEAFSLGGFSLDGRYLQVNYANDQHILWDLGQQRMAISNIPHARCCDFTADGQMMAVGCADGQLRRFSLKPIRPLPSVGVNPHYHAIKLRHQADLLAGFEMDKSDLEVCDLPDGSLRRTFSHPSPVGNFAWSSDGIYLAVGCENGRIYLWNALTGEKRNEFPGHQDLVTSVGFSHSGWLLGSSSWDGQFCLWDVGTGRALVTAPGWSYQAMFSADDRRIGRIQRGRQSGRLEVMPSSILRWLKCEGSVRRGGSYSSGISVDGRLVAAASLEGVHIWVDRQTAEPFVLPVREPYSVIFTPDGTNLITCGRTGAARWPLQLIPGTSVDELRIGPPQPIRSGDYNYAALTRDGKWLAISDFDARAVTVCDVRRPTNYFRLEPQPRIQSTAISPDGRWVAAGNFKGSGVKVWEFASRQVACTLPTPSTAAVGFSPDSRWLAVSGVSLNLWETATWKRRYTLAHNRSDLPSAFAFSPDGRILAFSDGLSLIHLVAADSGQALADLEAPVPKIISFLRFSADGSQLFALEWSRQIQVWDLRRIREELRLLNLDWNAPPLPPEAAVTKPPARPLQISLAAQSLEELATLQARNGKWKEAADGFASLIQREPSNHLYCHSLAPLLATSGDLEKYRNCCKEIIARFRHTTEPNVGDRMAKDCSILRSSGADPAVVGEMAAAAATAGPTNRYFAYFQCTIGLVEYRRGHFADAVNHLDRTIAIRGHPGNYFRDETLYAEAYATSAMARFQLKQGDAARAALAEANNIAAHLPKPGDGDLGPEWRDWLIGRLLVQEAKTLIEGRSANTTEKQSEPH